jgi:RIO kinase 1
MFTRDVDKITSYYALFAPELKHTNYAKEMWSLYEEGELQPEMALTGLFEEELGAADVDAVLLEIKAVMAEEAARLERQREAEEPD